MSSSYVSDAKNSAVCQVIGRDPFPPLFPFVVLHVTGAFNESLTGAGCGYVVESYGYHRL